jgi:riboflavin kinase/FMN adenylyltransferase
MLVIEGYGDVPEAARHGVLAIGNFDGVHRGHQALIGRAVAEAERLGAPAGALVFEPHPRAFFQPDRPLFRLSPLPRKLHLLEALGLGMTAVLKFDSALAALSAEDFIRNVLVDGFAVRHIVVGYDFHFGKGRLGSPTVLAAAGAELNFGVTVVAPVGVGDTAYSSSRIRDALTTGRVADAARELGHRWRVAGEVVGGAKRGTGLGFPTANVRMPPGTVLGHGIYAVRVHVGSGGYGGAAYYGSRPTFDNGAPVLEVFLFDFDDDLYGQTIEVEFVAFVRGDMKFESGGALAQQMERDCEAARAEIAALGSDDPLAGLPLAAR